MKMKEVGSNLTDLVQSRISRLTDMRDERLFKAIRDVNQPKYDEKLNQCFGGAFENKDNFLVDIIITIVIFGLCYFIPLKLIFRILIALLLNLMIVFIRTKGFYYMIKELKYRFNKIDYSIDYKPKFGKYEFVIIGKDNSGTIHADLIDSENSNKLLKGRLYVADKETLGDMISRYKDPDAPSLGEVSDFIENDLVNNYQFLKISLEKDGESIEENLPREIIDKYNKSSAKSLRKTDNFIN